MFSFLRKLFHQVVTWFRPDSDFVGAASGGLQPATAEGPEKAHILTSGPFPTSPISEIDLIKGSEPIAAIDPSRGSEPINAIDPNGGSEPRSRIDQKKASEPQTGTVSRGESEPTNRIEPGESSGPTSSIDQRGVSEPEVKIDPSEASEPTSDIDPGNQSEPHDGTDQERPSAPEVEKDQRQASVPTPTSQSRDEQAGRTDQQQRGEQAERKYTKEDLPVYNRRIRRQQDRLRRKLEKARKRHDEWVTPHGPQPIPIVHPYVPHEHGEAAPADEFCDPNARPIAGEWIEGDGQGDVLFEESEFYGTFNFRDTILKQLDRYWVYIERMEKHDPDAYGFYKQLGATLLPYIATGTNMKHDYMKKYKDEELEKYKSEIKLTPWFIKHWPTFGCICIGTNPLDEERERTDLKGNLWTPKFAYFVRLGKVPWYIQPVHGGKLYLLTMWWDRPDHPKSHHKWGTPNTFPIWISDDGQTLRALKTREMGNGSMRPEHDWRIPHAYKEWAKQYGLTPQLHLTHIFCHAARDVEQSYYATCRVEISKGDLTAVFGIEPQRIPYFFQDRDVTLNRYGHKERVFHVVRAHMKKDGTPVPIQYRGLKEFEWAGYHVSITIPGKDHFLLQEFNVPVYSVKDRRPRKGMVDESEIAGWLKRKLKAGFGAFR